MSKWSKGVDEYADELTTNFRESYPKGTKMTEEKLLNGARNWEEYSYGGNSLIYDGDIANRLATPSEIKRVTRRYKKSNTGLTETYLGNPNSKETWLDTQARALYQASRRALERELGSKRSD